MVAVPTTTSLDDGAQRVAPPRADATAAAAGVPADAAAAGWPPRLGELESTVMHVLWEARRPLAARDVLDAMPRSSLAYTTVATVLGNLVKKQMVTRERHPRSWSYAPVTTRCRYAATLMARAMALTDDSSRCLRHFVAGMSTAERAVLADLLAEA